MAGIWHCVESGLPKQFSSLKEVMALEGETITEAKGRDVIRVTHKNKTYYVKRYTLAGKGLRAYLGRSRVRAEWENLQYFRHLQVPTVKLVAFGEDKSLISGYKQGAYIMHALNNVVPLDSIAQHPELIELRSWRLELLELLAHYVQKLHTKHFIHGDLYWRNLLLALEMKPTVYFIDCPQGKKMFGPQLEYGKVRDIACLAKESHQFFSRTDLLRFFKWYRGIYRLKSADKAFIRKVLKRLQ